MNIKPPLALALLMTASSAMAQLTLSLPPLSLEGYQDPNAPASLGLYSTKIPDDASFNCSTYYNMNFSLTVKFEMCTPEQERSRLSFLGLCPLGNMACRNYMNRIMLPPNSNGAELLGAKDSGPNTPCQVPPCLNAAAAAPEEVAAEGAAPQPGSGEVYGPPAPAGSDAQDKKALEKARKEIGTNGVKDVVDLGNGNIAKMRDDGTVQMCGGGASACAEPVPADSVNNPKIQAWVADNKGGYAGVNQPGGISSKSNPGRDKGAPEASGRGAPADNNPGASASDDSGGIAAYDMGRSLGDETGALSGPGGPSSSGRGSGGSGGYSTQAAAGKAEKVDQAEFKKLLGSPDSFTYPVLGALSEKAAAEINPNVFDAEAKAKQDSKVELKFRGIQTEAQ